MCMHGQSRGRVQRPIDKKSPITELPRLREASLALSLRESCTETRKSGVSGVWTEISCLSGERERERDKELPDLDGPRFDDKLYSANLA